MAHIHTIPTSDPLGTLHDIDEWQSKHAADRYDGQTWDTWKSLDHTKSVLAPLLSPLGRLWLAHDEANRKLRNAITTHDAAAELIAEGNPTRGELERENEKRQAVIDAGREVARTIYELLTVAAGKPPLEDALRASVRVEAMAQTQAAE